MTHGTPTGYIYHGCRCAECTRAQRDRMRVYRARGNRTFEVLATTRGTTEIAPRAASTTGGRGPEPHGGPEHG
jgi:hypothetical protein